jgi:NAD(P)-dependent dehydrogenase (short-subunit alcohol dehydrogenase family)
MPISDEELERCLSVLRAIDEDRSALATFSEEKRRQLMTLLASVLSPDRVERRRLSKAFRKKDAREAKTADDKLLAETGMRRVLRAPIFEAPSPLLLAPAVETAGSAGASQSSDLREELSRPRSCYICKNEFRALHFYYDSMCPACGDFNWEKRNQSVSLEGRVALVTGARVKIGFHTALKLLRAGAQVVVVTRFPRDAALRYEREPDYAEWQGRLSIHGVDLRHTPSVELFARQLAERLERLDFIINNACQTVRRPTGYYAHLLDLADPLRLEGSAQLSQVALLPEDLAKDARIFPDGRLDRDLQQVDLRTINSWRLPLADVPTIELLEVQLVNAVAPFVLNARLKPLMIKTPGREKHIVNVSAMEGQFYRSFKTDKHPHTNMAKAALNMLTRTSAQDYVKDGIHMNSVDTGWVTDEDPIAIAEKKAEEQGFSPPLDIVDGAARILAPIFDGLKSGEHIWGQFFKDYRPAPW